MKKKTIIAGLAAVLLVSIVAVVLVLVLPGRPKPPVRIKAFFHLYNEPVHGRLTAVLEDFRSFYPEVDLEYRIEPYVDMRRSLNESLAAMNSIAEGEESWGIVSVLSPADRELLSPGAAEPAVWISSSWRLFYEADHLAELGFSEGDISAAAWSGLDGFIDTFAAVTAGDETVFVTGTAFNLPWYAWVQHLELLSRKGEEPSDGSAESWMKGIEAFDSLVVDGTINPDHRQLNQAGSQLGISEGRGLFVLSDDSIYSTYQPTDRDRIKSLSFPGSEKQGWRVGSGIFLGGFTPPDMDPRIAAAEELLLEYLHSEGVSERFLKDTGISLLPRRTSWQDIKDLPSLTGRAGEPEYRDMIRLLNQ